MTKKISVFLAVLLLACCLLSAQAFAVIYVDSGLPQPDGFDQWNNQIYANDFSYSVSGSVNTPVIVTEPSPILGCRGEIPTALRVDARSYDGGYLCYQWYVSYSGGYNDLYPINGAVNSAYTPSQELGTSYYCVSVYNVLGSMRSNEVFSTIVPVTYSGIEIAKAPNKLNYTVGSAVDLTGLVVNVFDGYSYTWQSNNGSGLNVYPSVFETAGNVAVEVSYNGSNDVFYVNVANGGTASSGNKSGAVKSADGSEVSPAEGAVDENGEHVHSFGEWEVIKPATCVTTGTETRTCACGETETQEIPRTDHTWDDGVVTKEPTETSNGAKLFTCTVCKANKSEIIPAGSQKSIDAQTASLNINGGDPEKTNTAGNTQTAPSNNVETVSTGRTGANENTNVAAGNVSNDGGSSGWWLIPVSALLLVGTGTGAYYIMRKKGSGEQ